MASQKYKVVGIQWNSYPDKGCEYVNEVFGIYHCVACPLDECREIEFNSVLRNRHLKQLSGEGVTLEGLALRFHITEKHVTRILKG